MLDVVLCTLYVLVLLVYIESLYSFIQGCPGFRLWQNKTGIRAFFGNPAKSGSSQIFSRIWRILVQLQYSELITDKTNAVDLHHTFTSVPELPEVKNTKFIAVAQVL